MAGHFLWVLVWTGACYWHGVGGFMFNSSSSLLGGEHSRAFEQPAGAASTSTTIPQPTACSAPTAREISRNNRARLHQLSQGFYSKQLLRRAFRAIARARDASGDVSSPPARAEGAPPPAPQVPSAPASGGEHAPWLDPRHPPPRAHGPGASAPTAGQGLWVLVWTGACYWHGVGGFMFNSSSSSSC